MALPQGSNPAAEATVEQPQGIQTVERTPFGSSKDVMACASAIQKNELSFRVQTSFCPSETAATNRKNSQADHLFAVRATKSHNRGDLSVAG
jgi:hypothetical protein